MWFKFKNVATLIIETFHLLLLTVLLGNPFNVKQIDDIVVMASTAKTTLASIIAQSGVGSKATTSSGALTATTATTILPPALFLFETTNVNQLYNASLQRVIEDNDSNEIDSMNDDDSDSSNYERVVLKNYVKTKHIALSNHTTGVETTNTNKTAEAKAGATSKLISHIVDTTPILTATTMSPASSAISTTVSSSSSFPSSSVEFDHQRFYLNQTQLDVLSSLSLLSLNDTTASTTTSIRELKTSSASQAVSASSSSSVSTLTFPNKAVATALRHQQGNEQSMHNTNSHLTVDNVNATIMSSSSAAAAASAARTSSSMSPTKIPSHNTSTMTKGSSSSNGSGGSSTNTGSSASSANTATGNNTSRVNTGTTRISARKVDSKYLLPKSHKTDAPMLNYIFDTFSSANKHHHHDQRYGPHFEDVQLVGQPTNMTVQAGSSIHLNCRISLLQDKTVSWVRRNAQGENALDLLTVGLHAYTGDKRYKMEFQYPSNWRLKINNVKKDDEATYECQISTHPPRVIQINLHVNAPKVMIVDEFGDPLQEKYYEQDSTLQLSCVVRNVAMSTSVVFWKHSEDILNYDVTRGGVSVKTELMDDGANSTLFIAKINKADSGNYTCSISEYQNYTIVVHILNGESFAELHHGSANGWQQLNHQTWIINLMLATILLLLLPAYIHR